MKNYYNHPTYSFFGLHESFILGQLGTIEIKDENSIVTDEYSAFAIKFKLPGEHRFDETTYNGEIQVHFCSKKNLDQKGDLRKKYKDLIGING